MQPETTMTGGSYHFEAGLALNRAKRDALRRQCLHGLVSENNFSEARLRTLLQDLGIGGRSPPDS